jgi:hypothetical protein
MVQGRNGLYPSRNVMMCKIWRDVWHTCLKAYGEGTSFGALCVCVRACVLETLTFQDGYILVFLRIFKH